MADGDPEPPDDADATAIKLVRQLLALVEVEPGVKVSFVLFLQLNESEAGVIGGSREVPLEEVLEFAERVDHELLPGAIHRTRTGIEGRGEGGMKN